MNREAPRFLWWITQLIALCLLVFAEGMGFLGSSALVFSEKNGFCRGGWPLMTGIRGPFIVPVE